MQRARERHRALRARAAAGARVATQQHAPPWRSLISRAQPLAHTLAPRVMEVGCLRVRLGALARHMPTNMGLCTALDGHTTAVGGGGGLPIWARRRGRGGRRMHRARTACGLYGNPAAHIFWTVCTLDQHIGVRRPIPLWEGGGARAQAAATLTHVTRALHPLAHKHTHARTNAKAPFTVPETHARRCVAGLGKCVTVGRRPRRAPAAPTLSLHPTAAMCT